MKNLPGWVFLVFFRYEEPNELGVAHPALPLHGVTPGYGRKTEVSSHSPLQIEFSNHPLCLFICVCVCVCVSALTE